MSAAMPPLPHSALATKDDLRRVEQELAALRETIGRVVHDQDLQFTRIAQIQADIDLIRAAWGKVSPPDGQPYAGPERRKTNRKTR